MNKKKIHIYTQYYYPISNACSNRVEKHILALKDNYDITVITWMPNYPTGIKSKEYKWKIFKNEKGRYGEKIKRTYEFPTKNEWSIIRLLNYVSFMISSFIYGLFTKKPDLIIVTSPPIFAALSVLLLSKIKKIPYILEVRDLWPDSVVALWIMTEKDLSYKIFSWLEHKLYTNSNHIIWVTKGICKSIEEKWIKKNKIDLFYNVFNTNQSLDFTEIEIQSLIEKFSINTKKKIFLYAWNHSKAQNLYNILYLAKDYKEWNFYFMWDWETKKELEIYVKENWLDNVYFLWQQKKEDVYKMIKISNFCTASLENNTLFNDAVPTKILEYLAFWKPVICFIKGDLANKIQDFSCWVVVDKYDNTLKNQIVNFTLDEYRWKELIESFFSYNSFKEKIKTLILKNMK